ncbi:hypothetical protein B1759_03125 [Rubrivirga sp. SAORIC476]|uniref:hypothetical protein n=1 Tax=Rubrivirga sp. SAORIC476 TaxID=1961794 RepID=UPI000BA9B49B|nr:hypothetical protein [Rubrivirga sp. SAORIC476]PAP80399.1 hypothetical protein B1759_03125 [Rubrivirga sp. SAORIC476]
MISRIPALLASAALIVSLAACDSFTPDSGGVASSDIGMNDCLPYLTASGASIDTGCGGGGGGGTGGGGTTTTQYRMTHGASRSYIGMFGSLPAYKYQLWTKHEVFRNGKWERTDGRNNGVVCRYVANGQIRDQDIENNASMTTLTFSEPGGIPFLCEHSTTSPNGQVHTATSYL